MKQCLGVKCYPFKTKPSTSGWSVELYNFDLTLKHNEISPVQDLSKQIADCHDL